MQAKQISIRQAVNLLREQGYTVSFGTFEDLESFVAYVQQHYIPQLRKGMLAGRLSGFLADDLKQLCS